MKYLIVFKWLPCIAKACSSVHFFCLGSSGCESWVRAEFQWIDPIFNYNFWEVWAISILMVHMPWMSCSLFDRLYIILLIICLSKNWPAEGIRVCHQTKCPKGPGCRCCVTGKTGSASGDGPRLNWRLDGVWEEVGYRDAQYLDKYFKEHYMHIFLL